MITVRHYTKADWETVDGWWKRSGEIGPLPAMMPIGSSFVAEIDGAPALAVAVYLTNTPEVAYAENFIGNPELKGALRRDAAVKLSDHIASFAKSCGYKRLLCMTNKPALLSRYVEFGYTPTLGGVTTLVRTV